jgi:hypothetical protein
VFAATAKKLKLLSFLVLQQENQADAAAEFRQVPAMQPNNRKAAQMLSQDQPQNPK